MENQIPRTWHAHTVHTLCAIVFDSAISPAAFGPRIEFTFSVSLIHFYLASKSVANLFNFLPAVENFEYTHRHGAICEHSICHIAKHPFHFGIRISDISEHRKKASQRMPAVEFTFILNQLYTLSRARIHNQMIMSHQRDNVKWLESTEERVNDCRSKTQLDGDGVTANISMTMRATWWKKQMHEKATKHFFMNRNPKWNPNRMETTCKCVAH